MNCKSTDELTHEIKNATNIEDYLADNKTELLADTLAEQLNLLLSQKDLKNLAPNRLRSFGLSDSSLQYFPLICLLGIMRSIFIACIVLINLHANFLANTSVKYEYLQKYVFPQRRRQIQSENFSSPQVVSQCGKREYNCRKH